MTNQPSDSEISNILSMITSMASLDFTKNIPPLGKYDDIAAITEGLNMLSEELNSQVVDKARVDEINQKLDKFAYTTAHDLKSPLNTTTGLIQLLEMSIDQGIDADAQLYLSKLKEVNEHMKNLVVGILDYSKAHKQQSVDEDVDLNSILDQVLKVDNSAKFADIEIKGKLPTLLFNKTAAIQIVRNLIDNAIKYSDKPRCKIVIECKEYEKHYQLSFSDNGPGIAPEYHEQIFEIFHKIDAMDRGHSAGVGLATIKNIVEGAGGHIWIESAEGAGASFIFTLKKII